MQQEEERLKALYQSMEDEEGGGGIIKNSIAPTPRKAIPKGAVAKAKAALLETKKAETVVVETDKQVEKKHSVCMCRVCGVILLCQACEYFIEPLFLS